MGSFACYPPRVGHGSTTYATCYLVAATDRYGNYPHHDLSRHIGRCDGQRTVSGGVEVSKSCILIGKANDSDVELDAARP